MLLLLLKLNVLVNIEEKSWFGRLIYEMYKVKKLEGKLFLRSNYKINGFRM